jgi:tetratricopeptide (TPR) repeat protein
MRVLINFRLLLGLLISTAVLGLGVHLLHGYQVRRNAGALLLQAEFAREQGNPDRAADLLYRYLLAVPDDIEGRARYGQVLEEAAAALPDPAARARRQYQVLAVYEEALLRSPDQPAVRRRLALLAAQLSQWDRALGHLRILNELTPDDGELEYLLGRCLEARGQADEAVAWYDRATRHTPDRLESYVRLAGLLRDARDPLAQERRVERVGRSADQVMDELVAANPRSFRAFLERARYLQATEPERAADDLAVALRLAPDEADVLLTAAELERQQDNPDAARAHLRHGLKRHPQDIRFYLALAGEEERAGSREKAVDWLQQGLKELPGRSELLGPLANLLLQTDRLDEARQAVADLRRTGWSPPRVSYLEGRLLVKEGKWAEARRTLELIRPLLADSTELTLQTDLLLGQCYEHLGDPERQLAVYRRAAGIDGTNPVARQGLGSALLGQGKLDDAIREYRRLTEAPDTPASAWVGLARLLVLRYLGRTATAAEWQEVEHALDRAAEKQPDSVDVPILRAEILVARQEFNTARQVLEAASERRPDRVEFWVARAELARKQRQADEAQRILDQADRQLGDRVELRLARAELLTDRPITELQKLAERRERFPADDQERLLTGLAELCIRRGKPAEAAALWEKVAALRPSDLKVRFRLFELALQAGDEPAMKRWLEDIERLEGPDEPLGRFATASRLVWLAQRGDKRLLADARAQLVRVATRRPGWHRVFLCQAEIDELEGSAESALENYRRAIELGERGTAVVRRVVQLLYDRQRFTEADELIRKLQEQAPISHELQKLAAEISLRQLDHARARELAQQAVADSRDYRDHLWLGQLLWATGRRKEAEAPFRRAVELAPDRPDAWVALVQYQARIGQTAAAEQTISSAREKLPADAVPLALGRCYEVLGRPADAEKHYLAALAARPNDVPLLQSVAGFYLRTGQPRKAEAPLRRILDPDRGAAQADRLWARRQLAAVLLAEADGRKFRDTLALVEQNLKDGGGAEDLRIKAAVLAMWPNRHREAIALLEETASKQPPPTPEQQFLLARLYELDRDWPKARERLTALLAAHGDNPRFVAHYVDSMIRQGRPDDGQPWLDRLRELMRTDAVVISLQARLLAAKERGDDAISAARQYVAARDAEPRDEAERLQLAAIVLDDLGSEFPALADSTGKAAEELYRKHWDLSKKPASALVLAGFLARRGQIEEAVGLCEKVWDACPLEAVALTNVAVVCMGDVKGPTARRLEGRLVAALQKQPNSIAALSALAHLCEAQERYDETEALYRRIIRADGGNLPALNNLAYLLALRRRDPEALQLVNRAIDQGGATPDLLDTRAVVYLALRQTEKALADLQDAIDAVPITLKSFELPGAQQAARNPAALRYFHLAQARQEAGDSAAAARALKEAQALGLRDEDLHALEREAYRKLRAALAGQ